MIVDHTVTTVCVLFCISMYTIPIQTHSSQYLTLRQTRCLKVVTHLKQLFLKSEYYSCAKPKNKTPQIKVETKLVCNSQEYSIQLRTVPSRFSQFVTCIHFGRTTTGNVLYQSLFSKHCSFQTLNENIKVIFAVVKWALVNKKCDIFYNISILYMILVPRPVVNDVTATSICQSYYEKGLPRVKLSTTIFLSGTTQTQF